MFSANRESANYTESVNMDIPYEDMVQKMHILVSVIVSKLKK